ncbi:unnamed protein product [Phyllotreta striolata]|uniref:Protein takeout n=1 Tax=Phyllotreta striolata TaxID=444603 RepID=A0A9N9TMF4_PHYSR|nr:unnamed protein product [Phyllotreta striolata]
MGQLFRIFATSFLTQSYKNGKYANPAVIAHFLVLQNFLKMLRGSLLIFLVLCFLEATSTFKIPSYIKPCSRSAPDFEQCCLTNGRAALPFILKGDKKWGIPRMLPLGIPRINVNAGNNFNILLTDVLVYGLDSADLKQVKIDTKNKKIMLKVNIPSLELKGNYIIDGKIMVLPIKGNGTIEISAKGGKYSYNMEYGLQNIKGEEYLLLTDKDKLDFKLDGLRFKLNNLFDGDQKLGDQMNNFLNENWEEVLNEFGLPISETVRSIGRSIASAYFRKSPYNELILE